MQPKHTPGKQLLMLVGIYACCMFIGQIMAEFILLSYYGVEIETLEDLDPIVILSVSAMGHFFAHIVTFLVFLRMTGQTFQNIFPKSKFTAFVLITIPILALLGIIGSALLSELSLKIFENNGFYSVIESANKQQETMTHLLVHDNPLQFVLSLFALCALPAVGEEFIYRGILQSRIMAATHDRHFSVIIASLIFAAMHFQPVNMLSIALLGLVLGYLYSYTKNIWYCVILHFLVNAIQVVQLYFLPEGI